MSIRKHFKIFSFLIGILVALSFLSSTRIGHAEDQSMGFYAGPLSASAVTTKKQLEMKTEAEKVETVEPINKFSTVQKKEAFNFLRWLKELQKDGKANKG